MNLNIQHPNHCTREEIEKILQRCSLHSLSYMELRLPGFDKKFIEQGESGRGNDYVLNRRTGRSTLAMMECMILAEKGFSVGFLVKHSQLKKIFQQQVDAYRVRAGVKQEVYVIIDAGQIVGLKNPRLVKDND